MGDQTKEALGQLVRYNLVGLVNTAAAYLLYALLIYLGIAYVWALTADYLFGMMLGFLLNKKFTFKHAGKTSPAMLGKMAVTVVLTYGANLATLWALVERAQLNEYLGQAIALVVVMACGFVGQKFWVFVQPKGA